MKEKVKELGAKNTELTEENSHMYDSYEERIIDMSNILHEAIYTQDVQQKKSEEYQKQIDVDRGVVESLKVQLSKLQE